MRDEREGKGIKEERKRQKCTKNLGILSGGECQQGTERGKKNAIPSIARIANHLRTLNTSVWGMFKSLGFTLLHNIARISQTESG